MTQANTTGEKKITEHFALVSYSPSDQRLHIRWGKLPLNRFDFRDFLNDALLAMGFKEPKLVYFDRGKRGRTDWEDLRISLREFEIHDVDIDRAALGLKQYLESNRVLTRYGMKFKVQLANVAGE